MEVIDIGGGFENMGQLKKLGEALDVLKQKYREEMKQIKWMAEPGRLLARQTMQLYTKAVGVRKRFINGEDHFMVTLNDSIQHSFAGKVTDGQQFYPIDIKALNKQSKTK